MQTGIREELSVYFDVIRHESGSFAGTTIELVPKGHNKAVGIAAVLKLFEIPWEASVVFGDSNNDIAMFEYAHTKIAMGNSSTRIQELAPYHRGHVPLWDPDGLRYLGLI